MRILLAFFKFAPMLPQYSCEMYSQALLSSASILGGRVNPFARALRLGVHFAKQVADRKLFRLLHAGISVIFSSMTSARST